MTRALDLLVLCVALHPAGAGEPVALFDGKDTAKWYTFLRDHGKDKDPDGNFTVRDGVLRVAGRDWGGLVTRDEYENYEHRLEQEVRLQGPGGGAAGRRQDRVLLEGGGTGAGVRPRRPAAVVRPRPRLGERARVPRQARRREAGRGVE